MVYSKTRSKNYMFRPEVAIIRFSYLVTQRGWHMLKLLRIQLNPSIYWAEKTFSYTSPVCLWKAFTEIGGPVVSTSLVFQRYCDAVSWGIISCYFFNWIFVYTWFSVYWCKLDRTNLVQAWMLHSPLPVTDKVPQQLSCFLRVVNWCWEFVI
jgi:hypothetical protein